VFPRLTVKKFIPGTYEILSDIDFDVASGQKPSLSSSQVSRDTLFKETIYGEYASVKTISLYPSPERTFSPLFSFRVPSVSFFILTFFRFLDPLLFFFPSLFPSFPNTILFFFSDFSQRLEPFSDSFLQRSRLSRSATRSSTPRPASASVSPPPTAKALTPAISVLFSCLFLVLFYFPFLIHFPLSRRFPLISSFRSFPLS